MILIAVLSSNASVQAGPVTINEVVQIIGNRQSPAELRFPTTTVVSGFASAVGSSARNETTSAAKTPLATGWWITGTDGRAHPEVNGMDITHGDVESTIDDCGEILLAGGGFPKWTLLFLAAVPFFFLDNDTPPTFTPELVPTPTLQLEAPTPPNAIPEPASVFLLSSGLLAFGAGWWRRKTKSKPLAQAQSGDQGV